ncbi:MAG TPA: tetratricopeptide repeat protein [Pyrinomonadaceae bacterium]|nr:tetratricopeptide repeat protein [Pyrinomonadaceae bacterium]
MSGRHGLFISFSTLDQQEVRKLFLSLELQGAGAWDYSDDGQGLPLSRRVDAALAEKIEACEYFIAVVSANSTDERAGRYTRFEVQHAIDIGMLGAQRVLPILLVNNPPAQWAGAYARLEPLLHVRLDTTNEDRHEEAVQKVCEYIKVSYVPPFLRDTRVFFAQRFLEETESLSLTNSNFIRLMRLMNRCAEKVVGGRWAEARELISTFLNLSAFLNPDAQLQYPFIIRGVCELQLGMFAEAAQTFMQVTGQAPQGRRPFSGLAFAGLGHAHFLRQQYAQALDAFKQALALIPDDRDIGFNLLGTLLQTDHQLLGEELLEQFDSLPLPAEDRLKIAKVRGLVHYKKGQFRAAARVFEGVGRHLLDDASAIYLAQALGQCGRDDEAVEVLAAAAARLDDPDLTPNPGTNLYHHLAYSYLDAGYVEECLGVYEDKLCRPDRWTRQYLVEYARILNARGGRRDEARMRDACAKALDPGHFPHADLKAEDFFYMGFANFLLGRHQLARYDYERSAGFCDKYYDDDALRL